MALLARLAEALSQLRQLGDQVKRMGEAHKAKGALEFEAAWFAASMRITELERLLNDLG